MHWDVIHSDVPNACLNGICPRLILVTLPKMWNEIMGTDLGADGAPVIIMANSLYGTPDAGHNWNCTFASFFLSQGYTQCIKEPCVFTKGSFPLVSSFTTWVDNSFATGGDVDEIEQIHNVLKEHVKVLGHISFALGIAFQWSENGV